jgi:WD40 repeat protein
MSAWDGTIAVVDVAAAGPSRLLTGHRGGVTGLSWSPATGLLVSGGADGALKVWDVTSSSMLARHDLRSDVHLLDIQPGGGRAAVVHGTPGDEAHLTIIDIRTGDRVWTHEVTGGEEWWWGGDVDQTSEVVTTIAWSPDGGSIAVGSWRRANYRGTVRIWDVAAAVPVRELERVDGEEVLSWVCGVAWEPTGSRIAVVGDAHVAVFDSASGRRLWRSYAYPLTAYAVAWSPDRRYVATAGDAFGTEDTVKLFDPATGRVTHSRRDVEKKATVLAWSPDSRAVAAAGWDRTARVMPIEHGDVVVIVPAGMAGNAVSRQRRRDVGCGT